MIKRQISFLFEDPGFCIDVFCTIAEPVRYYNRDTESGHGALAGFLMQHGVEALICGGIGGGAQAALAEVGIKLYGGVSGEADAAVHALLAENLGFNPDVQCSHHNQKHGDGGHTCGSHGCGNHGCH